MQRTVPLLILLASLLAPAYQAVSTPHHVPAKVGLVLIGNAPDGIALATDGSSLNADGRVSQEQRLFRLSKQGAVALTGAVSIQDPVSASVRGEVNIGRIAAAWSAAHSSDGDFETANRGINAAIAAEVNRFVARRTPDAVVSAFKFGVITAGFTQGKPVIVTTKYFMPAEKGKSLRTEQASTSPQPGELWIFGSSSAPAEIMSGSAKTLKAFHDVPAAQKFRSAQKPTLSSQDFIGLFQTILSAAESTDGKKLDGKRAIVAAPNQFATVTPDAGYTSMH